MPADGSAPPKLLAGGGQADSPQFLPDSRRVVFISARNGTPQVYLADLEGGSPKQVTMLSGGAQPPLVVSPDGRRVAFVSDVFPDCRDEGCNKSRADELDKDPVKARRLTGLMFRHWDEWRESCGTTYGGAELARAGASPRRDARRFRRAATVSTRTAASRSRPTAVRSRSSRSAKGATARRGARITDVWVVPATGGDVES